jgi:uncharacterized protein
MNFLFPKQPAFFNYFKDLNGCIREISTLFHDLSKSFDEVEKFREKAEAIEHRADDITNVIIDEINRTFITPFDREDIYALAQKMDDIVDFIENAIQNIYIYELKEKREVIDEFSKLILDASENLSKLVRECFKKKMDSQNVNRWILEMHELEDQGDAAFQRAIRNIFSDNQNPIDIIKWKDVIEDLEDVMDQFNIVGSSIVGVIVKSS